MPGCVFCNPRVCSNESDFRATNKRVMPANQLIELSESSLCQIRKTNDTPPMISVLDVIAAIKGCTSNTAYVAWRRLIETHPETLTFCHSYNFRPKGGGPPTPVTTASGIVQVIMVLPGKAAAGMRKASADLLVRYLGGDITLVGEICENRQIQEQLPPEHPARIFGETVENDRFSGIKMDIEEATLQRQLKKEQRDVVGDTLEFMQKYELPIDETIKIPARDMIANITFGS